MKIFSLFCCFMLIFPASAISSPPGKVTDIKKGDPAPFSGVLLTNDVATRLYLDTKFSQKACDLQYGEKLEILNSKCERDVGLEKSKLNITTNKFEKIINAKNDRISFLEKRWAPRPWYESNSFWLSMGVISGILITVSTGYALSAAVSR